MSSVPHLLAFHEQEQLEESCQAEHRLDFLIVRQQFAQVSLPCHLFQHVAQYTFMTLPVFFVPFAESFKLVYVSWIGLYLNYADYT